MKQAQQIIPQITASLLHDRHQCIDRTTHDTPFVARPQSFVDSMMVFVNRRIGALVEVLSPRDAACALARRLRHHVQAHDAFTAALRIRAGRQSTPENGVGCTTDRSGGGEGDDEKSMDGGDEDMEEHDVQARFSEAVHVALQYSVRQTILRLILFFVKVFARYFARCCRGHIQSNSESGAWIPSRPYAKPPSRRRRT